MPLSSLRLDVMPPDFILSGASLNILPTGPVFWSIISIPYNYHFIRLILILVSSILDLCACCLAQNTATRPFSR